MTKFLSLDEMLQLADQVTSWERKTRVETVDEWKPNIVSYVGRVDEITVTVNKHEYYIGFLPAGFVVKTEYNILVLSNELKIGYSCNRDERINKLYAAIDGKGMDPAIEKARKLLKPNKETKN